ncbi:MAG TPA: calcium/proton exchanger [Candidatus Limnocylindrales bacterium]
MPFADRLPFSRRTWIVVTVAVVASVASAVLRAAIGEGVVVFVTTAVALGGLAATVGEGTDQLGRRLGPGATGVLQSALGNLPELFIGFFALQAGLVSVVQAALVGSILANSLLVLGIAFIAGGLKHGTQSFGSEQTRMMSVLLFLAVAGLAIPFLATEPGAPDAGHQTDLSVIVSVALLVVFVVSIPFSVRGGPGASAAAREEEDETRWPLSLTIAVVGLAALTAAFVSDWFVESLKPAMGSLGMSEAFAGLVVVAIAGNAVENVVGIQMALRNKVDLAVSLILNSSLQVALALAPVLVLLSVVLGGTALTLVLSPLLIGALILTALLSALIVVDGQSTWLEGAALVGLYVIIAASVWWGPAISA